MHHAPRKRFGQHFLHDKQVIGSLVSAIAPLPSQHIVEIGPGQGALTVPVLKAAGTLDVVELDRDLIPALKLRCEPYGTVNVHQADALEFDFASVIKNNELIRVIGNLPYNISTPLIFHLLDFEKHIADMHFMLQKEVVDRLAAHVDDDAYGRLSIMVQYHCEVTALFDVPPEAFYPPPKVESSIVRMVPYRTLPFIANDYALFAKIVKAAFAHRRKTLRNCLKDIVTPDVWEKCGIDPGFRAEQLNVSDYVRLTNSL